MENGQNDGDPGPLSEKPAVKDTPSHFAEQYRSVLKEYIGGAGEAALMRAYELGRKAIEAELGVLELVAIHHEVLVESLHPPLQAQQALVAAKAATSVFLESLAPYEITLRSYREASEALRSNEERYRKLFDSAKDIIFTLDLQGNITSINQAGMEISGTPNSETPSINIAQILAPEYWELAREIVNRRELSRGSTTHEAEILSQDGRRLTMEVSAQLIRQDGKPVGIQGIARDVTERKRADEKFQGLLEAAPDAMVVVDEEGKIVLVNAQVESTFGYARNELLGESVEMLVPDRYRRRHAKHRAQYLASPRKRPMGVGTDLFGVRKDGVQFPVEVSLSPLETEEGLLITSTIRDITDRKRTEEALQQMNEVLEQEASRIAHALHDEAGQLLASVHIAIGEIAESVPRSAREQLLHVKLLLDEIEEQLRRFSHELRPTILDDLGLKPALDFLVRGFQGRTGIQVAMEYDVNKRLSPQVETAIYRVVQEALTNAARHAKASHVKIRITQSDGMIRGSIRDDGIGFDLTTLSTNKGRPGIGLTGMRARMDAVGGRLSFESRPGQGTSIQFSLLSEDFDADPNTVG